MLAACERFETCDYRPAADCKDAVARFIRSGVLDRSLPGLRHDLATDEGLAEDDLRVSIDAVCSAC